MTTSGLPETWAVSPLGHLGVWNGGGTPTKSNPAFWKGDIPWASPKDIKVASLWDSSDHVSTAAIEASATTVVPKGSVLVVTRSGILSHTLPIATNQVPLAINQDLKAITPFPGIDADYLAWTLRALERRILKECSKHGTTVPSVEVPRLQAFDVPVAPPQEQRRIVAKIEELFSELDKSAESLKTARRQLEVYRQSVLKHAFEGKLTAQWREENKDKLETPEQLPARIKQERVVRYEQQLREWKAAVKEWEEHGKGGKKPSRPVPPKSMGQIDRSEINRLPSLPDGWQWAHFSWLLSMDKKPMTTGPFGTMLQKHEHQELGVPVLGIENIGEGRFLAGNKIFVSEEKAVALSSFEVGPGELIISRSGTVGEICTVPLGLGKALISTNLLRVSLNQKVLLSQYFVFMFQGGEAVRSQVKERCKGSSRDFLNQSILQSVAFPICGLQEQIQIVREIDERLSLADQLLRCIESELVKSNSVRQSILKKAFAGQLVAQDPRDERASVLLGRIMAERKQAVNNNQSKKTKKRRTTA